MAVENGILGVGIPRIGDAPANVRNASGMVNQAELREWHAPCALKKVKRIERRWRYEAHRIVLVGSRVERSFWQAFGRCCQWPIAKTTSGIEQLLSYEIPGASSKPVGE